jgi:hypothetical protein
MHRKLRLSIDFNLFLVERATSRIAAIAWIYACKVKLGETLPTFETRGRRLRASSKDFGICLHWTEFALQAWHSPGSSHHCVDRLSHFSSLLGQKHKTRDSMAVMRAIGDLDLRLKFQTQVTCARDTTDNGGNRGDMTWRDYNNW